ncbi:MAG: transcriptional regulator, partial [Vicinamibacterales bacterium]
MHTAPSWRFGPFEFDAGSFRLRRDGQVVWLEPKAVDLLRLLLERSPAVVEKAEIFDVVWHDVAVTDNALTRVIAQLRRALDDDARSPRYIETVATRGYRFIAELRPVVAGLNSVVESGSRAEAPAASVSDVLATPALEQRRFLRVTPLMAVVTGAVIVGGLLLASLVTQMSREKVMQAPTLADGRPSLDKVATVRPAQVTTGGGLDAQPA